MNLFGKLLKKSPLEINLNVTDLFQIAEEKSSKQLEGVGIDIQETLPVGSSKVNLVKRFLDNGDIFLFFELEKSRKINIVFEFDDDLLSQTFDKFYEKPPFSNRYGENEISCPFAYVTTTGFSAMLSKQYYYKELTKRYDSEGSSRVIELIKEECDILFEGKTMKYIMKKGRCISSFSMILSKKKLFEKQANLESYIEYYFKNLKNNTLQNCTFFNLHNGSITKLPYSIEPFTKKGYGFNLHHSSRYEMTHFYRSTKERFYYDMLSNAIMQSVLYRRQKNGIFYTEYTSTWIKKDSGISSPYVDTRLNEAFCRMVDDYKVFNPKLKNNFLEDYLQYLVKYFEDERPSYRSENGVFFPDYFKDCSRILTHASLNHQIGIATLFYRAYLKSEEKIKLSIFEKIIGFIDDTYVNWINPVNGDLFYGCKMSTGGQEFFGEDYTYVTLIDLLIIQKYHLELTSFESVGLKFLIDKKILFLKNTEFNIYQADSKFASGEALDSKTKVLKYLHEIEVLKSGESK